MRAFVITQLNHPSKIQLTKDAPKPETVPDRILVDVYSAGLNFYDVSMGFDCLGPPISLSTNLLPTRFRSLDFAGAGETSESTGASVHLGFRVCWYRLARLAHPSGLCAQTRR